MQSFMWADKLKDEAARAEAQEAADRFTGAMTAEPDVLLEQVFAARQGAPPPAPPALGHASRSGILDAECLCRLGVFRLIETVAGLLASLGDVRETIYRTQQTCIPL